MSDDRWGEDDGERSGDNAAEVGRRRRAVDPRGAGRRGSARPVGGGDQEQRSERGRSGDRRHDPIAVPLMPTPPISVRIHHQPSPFSAQPATVHAVPAGVARTSRIEGSLITRSAEDTERHQREDPRRQPGLGAARPALRPFGGAGQQGVGDPVQRARGRPAELGGGHDDRCQQSDGAAGPVDDPDRAPRPAGDRGRAPARRRGRGAGHGTVAASASTTAEVRELPARTPAATRAHHAATSISPRTCERRRRVSRRQPCAEAPAATRRGAIVNARSRPPTMTSTSAPTIAGADGRVHVRTRVIRPTTVSPSDDRDEGQGVAGRRPPRRSRRPAASRRRRGRGGRRRRSTG